MIKTESTVQVCETNGKDTTGLERPTLVVSSHWNRDTLAVISFPGSDVKLTVSADDLVAAIKNATNTSRW